ncbi:hypothetical protein AB0I73_39710, partial [Streptomyces sp. NPDC050388]
MTTPGSQLGPSPPGPLPLGVAGHGGSTILVGPNGLRLRLRRETARTLGAAMCAELVWRKGFARNPPPAAGRSVWQHALRIFR